jgi:uncharacterized protein (DUF362 family)
MIYKEKADNKSKAAFEVTTKLIERGQPSRPVILKPNIVEPSPPPTTTDVSVVKGVIEALRAAGITDITVAEGSGTGDTIENFNMLGYSELGARLIDLDKETTLAMPVKNHRVWKEIHIPEILLDKFIVSVPVLKEHSMCGVTISLKNMIGILPAKYYSGHWVYKKSQVHKYDTEDCIADIISVLSPDWAVVDATTGMMGSHLSGTPIEPPINIVYASDNPLEADVYGCELLGRNWQDIKYLTIISDNETQKNI